ncbi:hypothetical protein LEP1GSC068_3493 [Leptospira sp. Fiocruz LV3954]|nr:hypothetical protein LEP1GSC068_3493 [Leptospira sp. Fiocruz LV3954]
MLYEVITAKLTGLRFPNRKFTFVYTKTSEGGDFIEPVPKVT